MSRLELFTPSKDQLMVESLYKNLEQRIVASPPGICPVDITRAFIEMCHAQTCGKCVPCRVGLHQLKHMITNVLNGDADYEILDLIEETSLSIMQTADCAIGSEAAKMVWRMVHTCRDDFEAHIRNKRCSCAISQPVPCVALCPAHVDIPGYIALVREGRYADAIQLIRKINESGVTILLIEHDMKVVMGVCQYIWVLEYGQLIAEGDPDAIRNNPRVIEAYLGEDVSNHA